MGFYQSFLDYAVHHIQIDSYFYTQSVSPRPQRGTMQSLEAVARD